MRRTTIIRTRAADASHRLNEAIKARANAMASVSASPDSNEAHIALNEALAAVPVLQAEVEALGAALAEAERLDREEAIAEQRNALLDYAARAKAAAETRVAIAQKLDALLVRLPGLIEEFKNADNDARTLTHLALPHELELGQHGGRTAVMTLFSDHIARAFLRTLAQAQFPRWASHSVTALDCSRYIEWVHGTGTRSPSVPPEIASANVSLADAVEQANAAFEAELNRLHKHAGLVEDDSADDAPEAQPMIQPPTETELPDGSIYTIDVVSSEWGAPK